MTYYYITNQELCHHGIKGQRWGIRRFQNEDGTLTEEGKKRYGTAENLRSAYQKRENRINTLKKVGKIAAIASVTAAIGYTAIRHPEILAAGKDYALKILQRLGNNRITVHGSGTTFTYYGKMQNPLKSGSNLTGMK